MEFSFEDHGYNKLIIKAGIAGNGIQAQIFRAFVPVVICWIPLAIFTAFDHTFWTGDITTSFITSFDTQLRFLISLPIFILSDRMVTPKLELILQQFMSSGIVTKKENEEFLQIIKKRTRFLKSHWTDLAVLVICYIQAFVVLTYESTYTNLIPWQMELIEGEPKLNFAGYWITLIGRPFILFLFYRWILRIIVWGTILRRTSRLDLNLFAIHPDRCGGLGFLGYSIRYFSPVAFAISVTVAGNISDFMLIEGIHLAELKYAIAGYFLLITLIFTLPLIPFIRKLIDKREKSIFENNDFANGMYREFRKQLSKGYEKVNNDDLRLPYYSSICDLNGVMENALGMKFMPFTIKDLIPLWVMSGIPFIGVVIIEVPVAELFRTIISFVL